ncbi:hypothetical protein OXX80_002114 [Metschnikowia pulcherrima]
MLTRETSDYTQKYHPFPSRDLSQATRQSNPTEQPDRATVADKSLSAFNNLKSGKKSKFVIFALTPEKTPIVVGNTSSDDNYESFLAELPENECEYASPDTAPVRSKMMYASSKDALRRALNGIAADIEETDFSEVAYASVLEHGSRGAGSH